MLKLNQKEKYSIGFIVASLVTVLVVFTYRTFVPIPPTAFLSFHLLLELLSIMVSLIIAMQGWLSYQYTRSTLQLRLGALFLFVGLLDIAHTLSYDGMPIFITESSVAKATWFWVVARLAQAAGFLFIYVYKDKDDTEVNKARAYRYSLIIFAVIFFVITFFSHDLPRLVIEGEGVTPLKRGFEYVNSVFQLFAIVLIYRHYRKEQKFEYLDLLCATVFLFLSAFLFTMYVSVFDSLNFLGHIYKAIGYLLLLKGIYFTEREKQYHQQLQFEQQLYLDRIKEKEQQAIIERQAFYDDLTGLPNQRLINRRLEQLIQKQSPFSFLLINLDRFKRVNDALGPEIGDRIIEATGMRLQELVGEGAYLARNRGDEFAIIYPGVVTDERLKGVCHTLYTGFERPIQVDNYEVLVNIRIGISIFPMHGGHIEEIIKKAYVALYSSKQQNHYFLIYHPYMDNGAYEGVLLENDLYKALANEEFALVYQPQIDVRTGRITGLEALIRWHSPDKGMVSPAEFIPIAEISGLIVPIGEWVLRTSLLDLKLLMDIGHQDLEMSVNLSMRQFYDVHLVEKIKAMLEEIDIPPQLLTLELTESVMMNTETTMLILRGLKELGIKISIDDFGTGYSSLAYLKRLPIDAVKIDQSFIHDLTQDQSDVAIVSTILSMAKHLRLQVVAEGVETSDQYLHLKSLGEEITIQGYLISKPLPLRDLQEKWNTLSLAIS